MNKNFKNVIITIVVSLVFGIIGGYGGSKLYFENTSKQIKNNSTLEENIKSVNYTTETSDIKKAIDIAYDTVVEIRTSVSKTDIFNQSYTADYAGSGVIISSDGYIVTNHHVVVDDDSNLEITLQNGEKYEAKVIGTDKKTDLALIKIDAKDLEYAQFADSDKTQLGDNVIVIGNPLGTGTSVTNGIISVKSKTITIDNETQDLIQTNSAVNQGNSGGGLFDISGKLIGIINSKSAGNGIEGMGYAIPSDVVLNIVEELKEYGYVKNRPTLGVTVTEVKNNFYFDDGLYITSVLKNSAADKAGLIKGDCILKVDDYEIHNYKELSYTLKKYKVNDKVKITIKRNNVEQIVELTLGAYEDASN